MIKMTRDGKSKKKQNNLSAIPEGDENNQSYDNSKTIAESRRSI